ncbi:MAG: hypothetical protein ABFD89_12675 [Bryobacteraceae bacterium]
MEKIPFSKIKPGTFFRMKGKTLYQRGRGSVGLSQIVSGPRTGQAQFFDDGEIYPLNTPVTPVNARIVIDG